MCNSGFRKLVLDWELMAFWDMSLDEISKAVSELDKQFVIYPPNV